MLFNDRPTRLVKKITKDCTMLFNDRPTRLVKKKCFFCNPAYAARSQALQLRF
jgi:hypothetical protein